MNNGYTHPKKLHEKEWRRTSHELNEEKSFFFFFLVLKNPSFLTPLI
jgi:hypothetical protein